MKKFIKIFLFIIVTTSSQELYAQLDSIYDQNVWRTFIVHLPKDYTSSNQYPIVLNLHGYNSNAAQEQSYTKFDNVADTLGFIVVYPNSLSNSWSMSDDTDVNFLSQLVDSISSKYSCNTLLFVTGMSDGGFMTYKFACSTTKNIKAIAVGSGNMTKNLQNSSNSAPKIPVMHFHGTNDPIVDINGVKPFILPVDSTIKWWVNHNNCNSIPIFTSLPDINSADNSTVEKYYYGQGTNDSEVIFYKIINGGHTWSGADPSPALGNTCMDINQSSIIGHYFASFCSKTGIQPLTHNNSLLQLYPNPTNDLLTIKSDKSISKICFYSAYGQIVKILEINNNEAIVSINKLPYGMYFVRVNFHNGDRWNGKIMKK
jgi:polyhydroxybutyrate depolymerase